MLPSESISLSCSSANSIGETAHGARRLPENRLPPSYMESRWTHLKWRVGMVSSIWYTLSCALFIKQGTRYLWIFFFYGFYLFTAFSFTEVAWTRDQHADFLHYINKYASLRVATKGITECPRLSFPCLKFSTSSSFNTLFLTKILACVISRLQECLIQV